MTIAERVKSSAGYKRKAAAALAVVIMLLNTVPETQELAAAMVPVAGVVGAAGIGHATLAGTIPDAKLAGIASLLSTLCLAARFVPGLQPYAAALQILAALTGASGLTLALPAAKK